MGKWEPVDSRQYIIAYTVRSAAGCPPDFSLPARLDRFQAGLFLPRDDPDWFGRSAYPPHLLLLAGDTIHILPHPASKKEPAELRVEDICFLEAGHFLLKGWLRFAGRGFDCKLPFNTRGIPSVMEFMERLRENLLGPARGFLHPGIAYGADLDIKFTNALSRELDGNEEPSALFFQPPGIERSTKWLLPRRNWLPGDVLAWTPRRLLWITDRERGSHSRFGSIATYAPLRALRAVHLEPDGTVPVLRVSLQDDCQWEIPIRRENVKEAADFAALAAIPQNEYGA